MPNPPYDSNIGRLVYSVPSPYPFQDNCDYDSLDAGIQHFVHTLREIGIETYESCEGGDGHAYPEPAVRFDGDKGEGFRALAQAITLNLPVKALRRIWTITDGEPSGPSWEIVFWKKSEIPVHNEDISVAITPKTYQSFYLMAEAFAAIHDPATRQAFIQKYGITRPKDMPEAEWETPAGAIRAIHNFVNSPLGMGENS